jgi:hypothetical protein
MLHRFSNPEWQRANEPLVVRGPRLLRDGANDQIMTVVERWAHGVAGARGPACLVFSTELGFTRLWDYPDNWNELSDAELIALSSRPRLNRTQSA